MSGSPFLRSRARSLTRGVASAHTRVVKDTSPLTGAQRSTGPSQRFATRKCCNLVTKRSMANSPLRLAQIPAINLDPSPSDVASSIRAWIEGAQEQRGMRVEELRQPLTKEETRYQFGRVDGLNGELAVESLDVFVHPKNLFEKRQILLHFYPSNAESRSKLKDRKETALVYFEASSGRLHGLHIAPKQRGRGLMKLLFLYYVLFCREFDLPARETAYNTKPLFAKLYVQMGYKPCCTDFPFLLLPRQNHGMGAIEQSEVNHVVPLPAENVRLEGKRRAGDTVWTFSPKFVRSQGLSVVNLSCAELADQGLLGDTVKLYAKTAWHLPDEDSILRRESVLEELSHRVNCFVISEVH